MKNTQIRLLTRLILAIVTVGVGSCGRQNGGDAASVCSAEPGDTIAFAYARNITMAERDGFTEVNIRNPWDTTKMLRRYALVPRGTKPDLPEGFSRIETPLRQSVIFSGVHVALADEFGHLDAVKGVCDVRYLFDPRIKARLASGETADCGDNMMPDIEKIISLAPDAVLLSPYENSRDYTRIERAGIPILECADYMEPTPLGRAEWMRFYGRLFGEGEKADSLFKATADDYNALRKKALSTATRPDVVFDRVYSGIWYVPERNSTTGRFVEDAGGHNPFDYIDKAGSAPLTTEEVLARGAECDFWFIRHAGEKLNYSSLGKENPVYTRFKAFRDKKIYAADTSTTHIFEEAAFHPQWLLSDLISILHPELGEQSARVYYQPLERPLTLTSK